VAIRSPLRASEKLALPTDANDENDENWRMMRTMKQCEKGPQCLGEYDDETAHAIASTVCRAAK
jgi:hypothetical protein